MNSVKRYANGTNAKGMDPNNYIISPAEALNDYNIMLAKAEAEANSNPWLPIVAIAGQAMQTGIGIAGKAAMAKAGNAGETGTGTGDTKAAMGMNNVQQDVEVEGGEMYETPQGQVGEFQGPSHEQGGISLEVGQDVEEGTKIYSDRLKIGKKTLAERKATREKQIANLEKIASDNLADEAVKNAAKRKMMAIQKEEAADLQFQDQVNNLQVMADTMVQTFACGTGMKGIKKYQDGTGLDGIVGDPPTFRFFNYDANGNYIGPALPQQEGTNPVDRLLNANKALEDYLNSNTAKKANTALDTIITKTEADTKAMTETGKLPVPTSTATPTTVAAGDTSMVDTGKDAPGFVEGFGMSPEDDSRSLFTPIDIPALNLKTPTVEELAKKATDSLKPKNPFAMTAGEDWAKANPLPEGVEAPLPESIDFKSQFFPEGFGTKETSADKKEPSKLMKALEGNIPAIGDITKLIGNYLGMTAGIKTAAEQRSTDVTHRNVFANAGRESQRLLDNAKQGIETNKAQAIVKATTVTRGGKKGARGSARGVNTMRGMDWLYDTALQQQIAEISANAAQQIAGIDTQKASVAMNVDQLKGEGEFKAAMANEAAKDAYYKALGLGRKDFATGLQQTGKDLNDMKQNKMIEKLMKKYGKYVALDQNMDLIAAQENKNQVFTTPDGKKYKLDSNNKLIEV